MTTTRTWWLTLGDFESSTGRIVELQLDHTLTARTREIVRWEPPSSRAVHGKGFTGAAVGPDGVYVCAFNGVYLVDPTTVMITPWLESDAFNDLHHVCVHEDRVLIANTGRDRVEVFGADAQHLQTHILHGSGATDATHADDPYFDGQEHLPMHRRRLVDRVHPNHICAFEGRLLVNRFSDRCVQDLHTGALVIEQTPGFPHDGLVRDGALWLTCTNGSIATYRPSPRGANTFTLEDTFDVFARSGASGWCRGLSVTPEWVLVGLTRITRMPRYRWCERPFELTRTCVLIFRRRDMTFVSEIDLGDLGAHPKLFEILEIHP